MPVSNPSHISEMTFRRLPNVKRFPTFLIPRRNSPKSRVVPEKSYHRNLNTKIKTSVGRL